MRPKAESACILRWDNLTDGEPEALDSLGGIALAEEEFRMDVHRLWEIDEERVADLHVQFAMQCLVNGDVSPCAQSARTCLSRCSNRPNRFC